MRAFRLPGVFRPLWLALLVTGLLGGPAAAEGRGEIDDDDAWRGDADDDAEGRGRHRLGKEQRAKRLEEIQRKMHGFLTAELSRKLTLDEGKSAQLGDALLQHGKAMRDARAAVKQERKKLKELLRAEAAPGAIETQLQALATASAAKPEAHDLLQRTESFLSPRERAQLLIAFPETMRKLRAMKHPRGGHSDRHP